LPGCPSAGLFHPFFAQSRFGCRLLAQAFKCITVKPGAEWLKPGLIGRVRHLKGEQQLRHATLQEIKGEKH
jgi:hypothetical protein